MDYDLERVKELVKQIDDILSELTEICGENPSVSRNIEMLKANMTILKHSTLVE